MSQKETTVSEFNYHLLGCALTLTRKIKFYPMPLPYSYRVLRMCSAGLKRGNRFRALTISIMCPTNLRDLPYIERLRQTHLSTWITLVEGGSIKSCRALSMSLGNSTDG